MEIEINGQKYELIERKKPTQKMSKSMALLLGMAMAFDPRGEINKNIEPEPDYITPDIIDEFKLIQNKKSTLTKRERDYIVNKFNYHFRKL